MLIVTARPPVSHLGDTAVWGMSRITYGRISYERGEFVKVAVSIFKLLSLLCALIEPYLAFRALISQSASIAKPG